MSSNTNPLNTGPQHHIHGNTEPLPGSKGGATTVDYTPETIDQTRLPPSKEGTTQDLSSYPESRHHRHHGRQPSSNTGDQQIQAEGARYETVKPNVGDKVIGKAEELAGKVIRNPQLQEKGAERAHGETTKI